MGNLPNKEIPLLGVPDNPTDKNREMDGSKILFSFFQGVIFSGYSIHFVGKYLCRYWHTDELIEVI